MCRRPTYRFICRKCAGGAPSRGHAKGADLIVTTADVLSGAVEPSGSVLLFDEMGQHNAASVAELLAKRGCLVEFATPDRMAAQEVGTTNQPVHYRELYKLGAIFSPNLELIEVYREGNRLVAALRNTYTEAEEERVVDHVVDHVADHVADHVTSKAASLMASPARRAGGDQGLGALSESPRRRPRLGPKGPSRDHVPQHTHARARARAYIPRAFPSSARPWMLGSGAAACEPAASV